MTRNVPPSDSEDSAATLIVTTVYPKPASLRCGMSVDRFCQRGGTAMICRRGLKVWLPKQSVPRIVTTKKDEEMLRLHVRRARCTLVVHSVGDIQARVQT